MKRSKSIEQAVAEAVRDTKRALDLQMEIDALLRSSGLDAPAGCIALGMAASRWLSVLPYPDSVDTFCENLQANVKSMVQRGLH